MKRTRQREQQRRLDDGARGLAEAELARVSGGDLYMYNVRWDARSESGG